MRGNVLNTLLQACSQDLNLLQYLVSYCLYYVLKDKTSENSAKKGTYLNAFFTFLNPGSSTNMFKFIFYQGMRLVYLSLRVGLSRLQMSNFQ